MMANIKLPWTLQIENTFIDLIRDKRLIWDKKDEFYAKKHLKREEWNVIATKLIVEYPSHAELFTFDSLRTKFNILKSKYKTEAKKIDDMKSKHPNIEYSSQWPSFSRLSFLHDSCSAEESADNLNDTFHSTTDVSNEEHYERLHTSETGVKEEIESESSMPLSGLQSPQHTSDITQEEGTTNHIARKRKYDSPNSEMGDIDDVYGSYITISLKSIDDPYKRELAKIELQKVLLKHRFGKNAE